MQNLSGHKERIPDLRLVIKGPRPLLLLVVLEEEETLHLD